MYEQMIETIRNNIHGRQLVMRWKHEKAERIIFEQLGIRPAFYIAVNKKYIDNVTTFSDEILDGKNEEYYLVFSPAIKWNKEREDKYTDMGFQNDKDICWFSGLPTDKEKTGKGRFLKISWKPDPQAIGYDIYENLNTESNLLVRVFDADCTEIAIPSNGNDRNFVISSFIEKNGEFVYSGSQKVVYRQNQ